MLIAVINRKMDSEKNVCSALKITKAGWPVPNLFISKSAFMFENEPPFETEEHDLAGYAALDFIDGNFESLAAVFPNYNPERFEPVTLKITLEAGNFILTIYAHDKTNTQQQISSSGKLPVKKFKIEMDANTFSKHIYHFAAALSFRQYDIKEMRVTNK